MRKWKKEQERCILFTYSLFFTPLSPYFIYFPSHLIGCKCTIDTLGTRSIQEQALFYLLLFCEVVREKSLGNATAYKQRVSAKTFSEERYLKSCNNLVKALPIREFLLVIAMSMNLDMPTYIIFRLFLTCNNVLKKLS